MKKLIEVLDSKNALVTFVTIISLASRLNSKVSTVDVTVTELFYNTKLPGIFTIIVLNFVNIVCIITKNLLNKEKKWLWSSNFHAQLATIIILISSVYFKILPWGIILCMALNGYNLMLHVLKEPKNN